MFASVFLIILGLCYCSQGSSQSFLGRPQLLSPPEALFKSVVEFECKLNTYPKNESILLQLYKEGKLLGEYTSLAGETATFLMVIKHYHEGNLKCEARAQNNSKIEPTVSYAHHLRVVEPVRGAQVEVSSGRVEIFEGKTLELCCKLIAGNHVSYTWLLNGQPVSQSSHHRAADEQLLITRTTSQDSGSYMCVATNTFNGTDVFTSNSSEVLITVKDLVSNPDISFSVLKEDSHNYSVVVTCQSTKGTLPVTFSLYNRTELVANTTVGERNAEFKVPLVFGQHLGWLQCQANNGDEIAFSAWIPLEVVPVEGPVTMHYEKDVGENYAVIGLKLYCKAAKGTHPLYQWFLNKTLLNDRGSFYHQVHQPPERSILLLSVGTSSAGTYHCEVSDSFDNSTAISSRTRYLEKEVLNRLPVLVVAIVFGSFIFLVLLVSICCWTGVVYRRRRFGEKSLVSLELVKMQAAYEGELDLTDYQEDADLVRTARGEEFDQELMRQSTVFPPDVKGSEVSVDEWPSHIVRVKKTLEDEAVEES